MSVRTERLGALGSIFDGPHATPTRRDQGAYFLNISSLESGRLDLGKSDHVDVKDFNKWTRRIKPQEGDLLFSYETRLGDAALMPGGIEASLGRRMALIRPDSNRVDSRYLLYAWLSPWFKSQIERRAIRGATVDRIPLNELGTWDIPISDLDDQRAIGDVLGALDDKIAANREASRSIDEYLAGAFERELSSAIQVRLEDVAEVNAESVKPAGEGWIEYVDISTLKEGELLTPARIPCSEAPGRARRALHSGDTLWSTVRPNRRSHALMLGSTEGLVASTGIAVITPRKCRPSELYEATRRAGFQEYLESVAEGSTYPAVRADRFSDAPIDLLQGDGRERFTAAGEPLRMLQWSLREESEGLAATRDELLPLLMSGKITIKDAENTVEEVV